MLSVLFIFVLLGCQPALLRGRLPLEDEGEAFLYVDPFPQEAERLRFKVEMISAVAEGGREIPLSLVLKELKPSEIRRQRLVASGILPTGRYIGFSFKVNKAILKVEDGEADLLVPETPVRIEFPFNVSKKRGYVFSLTFKYSESISGGFSFSPVFSITVPAKPIRSFLGYVTNQGSNNITVFDKRYGRVVGVIPTRRGPSGMALDQRLGRTYVASSGDDLIEIIDILSGEVIDRIKLHVGDRPWELAITPDGKYLLVVNKGSNTVSFIEIFSMLEVNRVNVGNGANSILIHPNGIRAFVFNSLSNTLSVLDISNKALVTTLTIDSGPLRGQFNRRGDRLYVIYERSPYVTILDPRTLSVLKRFSVRTGMRSIKVDTGTDLVYMGKGNDILVEVYDPSSFVSVDSIQTGGSIIYMTIDGEEKNIYFLNSDRKSLMVSNLVRKKIVTEMDVGEDPYWVVVMGER